MSRKFETEVEIVFDLDSVHALTSRRDILWQKISSADFLTTDEKREILGFPPLNADQKAEAKLSEKSNQESNTKSQNKKKERSMK